MSSMPRFSFQDRTPAAGSLAEQPPPLSVSVISTRCRRVGLLRVHLVGILCDRGGIGYLPQVHSQPSCGRCRVHHRARAVAAGARVPRSRYARIPAVLRSRYGIVGRLRCGGSSISRRRALGRHLRDADLPGGYAQTSANPANHSKCNVSLPRGDIARRPSSSAP